MPSAGARRRGARAGRGAARLRSARSSPASARTCRAGAGPAAASGSAAASSGGPWATAAVEATAAPKSARRAQSRVEDEHAARVSAACFRCRSAAASLSTGCHVTKSLAQLRPARFAPRPAARAEPRRLIERRSRRRPPRRQPARTRLPARREALEGCAPRLPPGAVARVLLARHASAPQSATFQFWR